MTFQEFKDKYEHVPVEEYPNRVTKEPLVSVYVQAYQHVNYIKDCLEGILMQETEFPVEILVGDDESSDGTREICIEYAKKYPDRIRLFLNHRANNIKIGGKPSGRFNGLYLLYSCRGKYIALCEGDDYWTDRKKLQKQVDFMEVSPDYSMCFTNARVKTADETKKDYENLYEHLHTGEYSGTEILDRWTVPTASVLLRKGELDKVPADQRFVFGDIVLFLSMAQAGKIWCINEKMVTYRRNAGGVTFYIRDYSMMIQHYKALEDHFGVKYHRSVQSLITQCYITGFISGHLGRQSFLVLGDLIKSPRYILPFTSRLSFQLIKTIKNKVLK